MTAAVDYVQVTFRANDGSMSKRGMHACTTLIITTHLGRKITLFRRSPLAGSSSTTSPPCTPASGQVASRRRAELVDSVSPGPDGALALDDADELLRQSLRESVAAAAPALLLRHGVQDPLHRLPAALAEAERHGDLQGDTATCGSLLAAEAEERRDAVDGEGEVRNRVQREVRGWGRAGEQRSGGGVGRWGRGAEDIENVCHVPLGGGLLAVLHDQVGDLVDDRVVTVFVLVAILGGNGTLWKRELVAERWHSRLCGKDCALLG